MSKSHNRSFEEPDRLTSPPPYQASAAPASMQRIEFTKEYQDEFKRLLAVGKRLERACKTAKAEYRQWERDLLRHIESRYCGL